MLVPMVWIKEFERVLVVEAWHYFQHLSTAGNLKKQGKGSKLEHPEMSELWCPTHPSEALASQPHSPQGCSQPPDTESSMACLILELYNLMIHCKAISPCTIPALHHLQNRQHSIKCPKTAYKESNIHPRNELNQMTDKWVTACTAFARVPSRMPV